MPLNNLAGRDALNRGLDAVRSNPLPLALLGIGAAWLIAANSIPDERREQARQKITGMAGGIDRRAGEFAAGIAAKIGRRGAVAAAADRVLGYTGNPLVDGDGGARPARWLHQMADMTQGALRSARDSGGAMINRVGNGANRVNTRLSAAGQRNPLMIGAIGVMAGAALAALLSPRRGGRRLHKPEEAGREAVTRVRQAAAGTLAAVGVALSSGADKLSQK